jgi:hypothetical protein
VRGFLSRLARLVREQLTRGVSPEALALTVALGAAIGVFPIFGLTTALCLLAGAKLRLNHPLLQAANHLMAVPQLLLIPVFVKAGEKLFGLTPVALDPRRLPGQFLAGPALFLKQYGAAGLAGVAAWGLLAPPTAALLYFLLRRGFRKMAFLLAAKSPGTAEVRGRNG